MGKILFWISLFIVFYSYFGYGILIYLLVVLKRGFSVNKRLKPAVLFEPPVTLVVSAYNEADFIEYKIENSLSLDYPSDKLRFIFITDGSNDATPDIIEKYHQIKLLH